jgi:hypothetical protein
MAGRYSIAIIAAVSVCGWVASVQAGNDDERVVIVDPSATTDAGQVSSSAQVIVGKIKDIDTIKDAAGVKHRVAYLEVAHDVRYQVHLGPKDSLKHLDLDKGDTITVHVVPGRFNGQYMFDAYRIRDDDGRVVQLGPAVRTVVPRETEVLRIERPRQVITAPTVPAPAEPAPAMPSPAQPSHTALSAPSRTVQGQIVDNWIASVPDYGQVQMISIRTNDGRTVAVDLGLRRNLPQSLSLDYGDWLQVTGVLTAGAGGESVLLAETLSRSLRIR